MDGICVVGSAQDGREAIELSRTAAPDVVLMDVRMPGLDGAEATAVILADRPQVAVLVLTTYVDDVSIARALRAGARGYLTKDASRDDIAVAIRAVAHGQATFDSTVSARLVSGLTSVPSPVPAHVEVDDRPSGLAPPSHLSEPPDGRLAELTGREREVLRLIGDGLTNGKIADRPFVSTSTAKTHINNLSPSCRCGTGRTPLAARLFGS